MRAGGIFTLFDIGASALRAERARMNVHANNMANANTTRDEHGRVNPYRRQRVFLQTGAEEVTGSRDLGVSVKEVSPDYASRLKYRYDPSHPDRVLEGEWKDHVAMPNVDVMQEMVDMMIASRAYEANLTVIESAKAVHNGALQIIA